MPEPPNGWSPPRFGDGTPREGYEFQSLGRCRRCPATMAWWRTLAGKMSPHDPDGTSHFATCPEAARFRR